MWRLEKISCCILVMTLSITVIAQRDTIFFNNGQILIGELKSISLGRADFDADHLSLLSIKVHRIKTIKAVSHIYRIETVHQETYFSYLRAAEEGYIKIRSDAEDILLPIQDISILLPLRGKTGAFWEGKAGIGYSFTRSSGIGRFNSDYRVSYTTRKYEVVTSGSIIVTQTDSTFEADNANASLIGSYSFDPIWDGNIFFNYQRNLELGLARRFQEGVGLGFNFLESTHTRAKTILGVVFSQEKNTSNVITPTQVEIPLILVFTFFKFNKPDMTLDFRQSFFAGITQWGRFRQEGQINISWKVIKDLNINLQLYDNFDNQPPGDTPEKLDYGVVFGFSYKFSQ